MKSSWRVAQALKVAIDAAYPPASVSIINLETGATLPAIILTPMGIGDLEGSWDQPHEMGEMYVQISCIGDTSEQASGVQMAVYRLVMRRSGSGYTTPLSVAGSEPLWRTCEGLGPVVQGTKVYRTDDTYCFKEMLL